MAVVAPGLLLLVFFMIQAALWLYGRNVAQQAAREGVSQLRVVVVGSDTVSALAAARVQAENYARVVGRESVYGPVATASLVSQTRVRVTVVGRVVSLIPGITLTVRASAEGEIEQFQVDS
jgi:Flp pilus assembly protein TadG